MHYDFIFFGAHPDDVILSCSGTIADLNNRGLNSLIISLTAGSYNSAEKGKIRRKELAASAEILGVDFQVLGLQDTEVREEKNATQEIFKIINFFHPSFVVTHHENDLHPDHANGNQIVKRAIHQYFVRGSATKKRLKGVLYFPPVRITNDNFNSFSTDFVTNISEYIDIKKEVIKQHQSQFPYILRNMEITISLNRLLGSINGVKYVEGFSFEDYRSKLFDLDEIYL